LAARSKAYEVHVRNLEHTIIPSLSNDVLLCYIIYMRQLRENSSIAFWYKTILGEACGLSPMSYEGQKVLPEQFKIIFGGRR